MWSSACTTLLHQSKENGYLNLFTNWMTKKNKVFVSNHSQKVCHNNIFMRFDFFWISYYTTLQSSSCNMGILLKKMDGYTIKLRQNYIFYISYIICCLLVKSHCRDYLEATHFRIHVFTLLPRPSVLDDWSCFIFSYILGLCASYD